LASPPEHRNGLPRRGFLAAGAGAFLCTIGGERVLLGKAGDAAKADAAARRVPRPASLTARTAATKPPPQGASPVDQLTFATPQPQAGGVAREYWIQARDALWDIVPTRPRRDQWHGVAVPGPTVYRAFVYQLMTEGFAEPAAPPAIPGPTLHAEVGDTVVVHFRNGLKERTGQALTMHPHGVKYNPEYDGVYLGDFTRAGGFIEPGAEFTYTWEATPDAVGVWPYHDHGPNHTLNTFRGLFGSVIVREKGAKVPDNESVLFFHSLAPPVTGLKRQFQCVNGRAFAGNTPTIQAKVGQDVAIHVMGMDSNFHDFHIHGHRWKDPSGTFVDTPAVGPNETITARFIEDNPGRWLYHCHVFTHQDGGMAGWYLVEP
jgi:FtsP/CotA-like multicopper oxidase with cupredoxin domain